jgi:hypothetical protein
VIENNGRSSTFDNFFYQPGEEWQGMKLWNMFNAHQPKKLKQKQSNEDGLQPLYLKL